MSPRSTSPVHRRSGGATASVLGAIATTCALALSAHAAPAAGASTIVLESHVGQRSSDARSVD